MIGSLAFLNPWALAALLALPALYFLLRITPPAPKTIQFPAARLLANLKPKQNTPSHTPWWLLLLRMMIAALLLIALARPVLNPIAASDHKGPLLLVVDTGWSAAQNWQDIQSAAENEIKQAGRQGENIFILQSAPEPGPEPFTLAGPVTQSDAQAHIRALKPRPWPANLKEAGSLITDLSSDFAGRAVWLSDGLEHPGHKDFLKTLIASAANISVYRPDKNALPFALKAPKSFKAQPTIAVDGPDNFDMSQPLRVQVLNERGKILDEASLETAGNSLPSEVTFDLPPALQNQAATFRIAGQKGAQARYLLDNIGGPKSVGIVAPEEAVQTRQLTEDSFFLGKALEPYASVSLGSLEDILEQKPTMIILPDIGTMSPDALNALSTWVDDGGLLLRFAGPNMAQSAGRNVLTPVPLRQDTRNVQGSLSWDKPLKLKPLAPESPLYGLSIDESIEIFGQILPESSSDLAEKVWAELEDGTPLITAGEQDTGLIVMVHTSASPLWSNLPLSGLYVQMLKRLLKFSGQSNGFAAKQTGLLQPVQIMDGFGTLGTPTPHNKPLDAANFETLTPGPEHPPGFYGRGAQQVAFNLGDHLGTQRALIDLKDVQSHTYAQEFETDLIPNLIAAALSLFILDALIMLGLMRAQTNLFSGFLKRARKPMSAALFIIMMVAIPWSPTLAQSAKASEDLYLAYIQTGNAAIDATSKKGLEVLAAALGGRTSAEPKGVNAINPETDTLAFYPLLYWPISASQPAPSSKALQNLQDYLDHGGTILVDTRDGTGNPEDLRRILGGLNIPPLTQLPEDHVITKSFYLLDSFPGRYEDAPLWVEGQSADGRDGVSSVIIGAHDWVGGWAELNIIQRGKRQYIQGATRRHELSLRFGINLVMYALTGNYKADQVHVPHILERLGNGKGRPR